VNLSRKCRPDSQVVRDGEYGKVFKPVRLLVLPNGGMVCLMHGYDDTWLVFSLDTYGVAKRSTVYQSKSFGDSAWTELCDELTAKAKNELVDKLQNCEQLTGVEKGDLAVELARLQLANDELNDDITLRAGEFVVSHTPEECEAHIAKELAAYRERKKAAVAGGDGEEL
jgi:hypothetical protein